jgi:chaperonin cofactor prefoldin
MRNEMRTVLAEQYAKLEQEISARERELSELKALLKTAKKALESIDALGKETPTDDGEN